jgi:hypothetical protein
LYYATYWPCGTECVLVLFLVSIAMWKNTQINMQ